MTREENSPDKSSGCMRKAAVFFAMPVLGMLVALAVFPFLPKQYFASAVIQVYEFANLPMPRVAQLVQDDQILDPVIEQLALLQKWQSTVHEPTRERLRQNLKVREIRDTELFLVGVYDPDPQQAAALANAIVEELVRNRVVAQEQEIENRLKSQKDAIVAQQQKVSALEREMQQTGSTLLSPETDQKYLEIKHRYEEARKTLVQMETQLMTELVERSMPARPVTVWERAEVPTSPAKPNIVEVLLVGALAGLMAGGVLAIVVK